MRLITRIAHVIALLTFLIWLVLERIPNRNSEVQYAHPECYSTVIAGSSVLDGSILLWSIALAHPRSSVYVATDKETYKWFNTRFQHLFCMIKLHWIFLLDNYNLSMSRQEMERAGVWSDFQMSKARVIQAALRTSNNTLFIDADVVLLMPILVPLGPHQLGVSPHYIQKDMCDKFGIYNGGILWTNQYSLGQAWIDATKSSRYFDQAAIENLVNIYKYFIFGEETNLGWWRPLLGVGGQAAFGRSLALDQDGVLVYKNKMVTCLHAHIVTIDCCSEGFAKQLVTLMKSSPKYSDLLAIINWAKHGFDPQLSPSLTKATCL